MTHMTYLNIDSDTITAERLVNLIRSKGVPIDQDKRNDFADFIDACSPVLTDALNLKPDTVLFALNQIRDPIRVLSFYNTESKWAVERNERERKTQQRVAALECANAELNDKLNSVTEDAKFLSHALSEAQEQTKALETDAAVKDMEILRLKAKLYDLMTA